MAPLDTHFIFNCSKVYYNSPAINTTSARSLDFESMENKRVFFECVFSVYGAVEWFYVVCNTVYTLYKHINGCLETGPENEDSSKA